MRAGGLTRRKVSRSWGIDWEGGIGKVKGGCYVMVQALESRGFEKEEGERKVVD